MRRKIYIQIFLVILILFISFTVYQKYFKISPSLDTEVINKETTNQGNTLVNITYESIDNLGRKYIITAESGTFDENEPDLIFMLNVIANIYLEDNTVIYIKSSKAEYNSLNYDTKF